MDGKVIEKRKVMENGNGWKGDGNEKSDGKRKWMKR